MDAIPDDIRDDQIYHVYPNGDLMPHETETRGTCWCRPDIREEEGGYIVIHNSLDGREKFETGERKPS